MINATEVTVSAVVKLNGQGEIIWTTVYAMLSKWTLPADAKNNDKRGTF